ncbi:uncharacterized protein LOC125486348 [Rhincodon typus]|uniref:uncharacterized protein LOC125486348 n=1 Tax=Rhincodon typus TaxID=259920 RepID=UPI0020307DF9|nr:uncharacterized protein LOC125486348 [Rhincodon typus]
MIKPRMFQNFSKLWYLSITDFKLSLFSHAFTRSPNAESSLGLLDLSGNKLESCSVESLAFAGLHDLTELKLNNNSLDTLKPLWFSGLTLLKKLHIQFNKISYLPPRTFEALIQLYHLNASSNLIQYISTDTFYGLGSLTDLDLSNNQLLFIDSNAFGPVKRLNLLYLNDNQLELLAKVPGSTQKLRLHSNHWECSCQLVLLLETCSKAIEDPGNLFCQSPEDVKGKPVLNLSFSYCSSTTLLPLTTPLRSTTPALQIIPTISVLAIIYGFIETFGACTCEVVNPEFAVMDTLPPNENVEDNQEERRQGRIHVSTELQRNVDRENVNSKVMQPCKPVPSSHLAADISHLQNKGIDNVTGKDIQHGKAGSRGDTETVVGKLCEIAQTYLSNSSYFGLCVSNQDKRQYQGQEAPLSERLRTDTRNFAGNLRNINSEAHDPETEGEDSPNVNDLTVLCNEAVSSQLEFKTGNQEKVEIMELQDIQTEKLEKNEAKALYREENEILEDACPPGKVIELNETSVNDCTSEMNRKILLDATNPIGSKVGTRGVTIDGYSRIAAISMGGKLLSSALFNGDGDTPLPDVEDRSHTTPILPPSSNPFGKEKCKLVNNKSISLPNICGSRHHTKKKIQESQVCSRTLAVVNVKPTAHTTFTSVEKWPNMNREMVSETFGHFLSAGIQTCVDVGCSSENKLKCKAQKQIQDRTPCTATLPNEEEITLKSSKSQTKPKENNLLQSLEMKGGLDDQYFEWQQNLSGDFQLSSSTDLQTSNYLHVSQGAFSETSHQQDSHSTLSGHSCQQLRFNLSQNSTLQQGSKHHSETYQFTSGHKLVADTELNVFDTTDGEENAVLDTSSLPDIEEFAHSKGKKPEHISPVVQKFVAGISEHVHAGTSISKDVALVDKAQTSDRDQVVLGGAFTKETVQLPESSAAHAGGTIASSMMTEDEMSSVGSVSTSFSWPYTWSAQSPEHWSQSSTTLESTLASNHSKANLSPNVMSKNDEPGQWDSSTAAKESNLDWEDDRSEAIPFQRVTHRNSAPINSEPKLERERHFQSPAITYSEKISDYKGAEIRRDSSLNLGDCDHRSKYSKNMYKSVFKIIEQVQHPVPFDASRYKVLQDRSALAVQAHKAKHKSESVVILQSPSKIGLQPIQSSGCALEMNYPNVVYRRWFLKSTFGNTVAERIPTAVREGGDLSSSPDFQFRKTARCSARHQIGAEAKGPVGVTGVQQNACVPGEFLQQYPPTREELQMDDELMLINTFYNLKKTLNIE